jgi:tetratricopeptide (TPR) repeat protein
MRSPAQMFLMLLAGLGLAGCSSTSPSRVISKSASPQATVDFLTEEDRSPEAIERRTEAHARYAAGVVLEINDKPEAAVEEYFKAAMADVRDEELVGEVTRRLLQLRQQERALELLTRAAAQPGASGQLYARLGMVYAITGKKNEAIEANRTAIRKSPRILAGYQNLVHLYLQNKQTDEALKVLDQAVRQANSDPVFLVELGELYASVVRAGGGEPAKTKALDLFSRAHQLAPTNPLLQQKLADGFAGLGESDRAAELYLKLLERFPNLPTLREKLTDLYLRKKDSAKAVEQLEAIVRNNPTSAQAYYLLGNLAFESQNFKKAAEHLSKALLLAPNFEQLYYDLAGAQVNAREPKAALQTLEKARARFPAGFFAEYSTAMAYSGMKDPTNALKHLIAAEVIARATETNRLTHSFYFQLGAAYERTQQFEEAEKYFRRCLAMSPKFSVALNYLGYMWAERGTNLHEARDLIQKAVEIEPKNAAYLDSLGWVLFKLNQREEALTWLQKAIEHAEEPDPTLYDHLGDVYSSLNKLSEAREAWRKALSIEANAAIEKKLGAKDTSERK